MLKERARIIALAVFAADLLLVSAAFVLAHWLRASPLPAVGAVPERFYPLSTYLPLLPVVLLIWALSFWSFSLYRSHRTISFLEETRELLKAGASATVILTLVVFFLRLDQRLLGDDQLSRTWIVLAGAITFVALIGLRVVLRLTARYLRARGYNYRTILIVGVSPTARAVAESIDRHRYWGYRIHGFLSNEQPAPTRIAGYPVLGTVDQLRDIVDNETVDEVIIATSRDEMGAMERLLVELEEVGVLVRFALNPFPHAAGQLSVGELDGIPLLSFSSTPTSQAQLFAKRLSDVVVSVLLLLLLSPLLVLIALLIKVTSPGPVLFRQTRAGLNGRRFTLLKFRTMIQEAERMRPALDHLNEMTGPVFKLRRDPRVTVVGWVLRRFSLDELPQLWNVLRGEMSLVGPRPSMPEEISAYERWQRRRLSMRPGLTCLWQISGRNDLDFDSWMELDLEYIDKWSPLLDLKILAKTIPVVLSGRGAW